MPLSAEHKRKISEGLKRYHKSCAGNKKNKMVRKEAESFFKRADIALKKQSQNDKNKMLRKQLDEKRKKLKKLQPI
jgi:hypothetical protein